MVYTLTFEYEFAREINTGKEHPISEFYLINRFSPMGEGEEGKW